MFYQIAKRVMWVGMTALYRIQVAGTGNIPDSGAYIICSNHTHAMDAVILAVKTRRRLFFMGKKEVFQNKFFDFFLRALGVFPVDRKATDLAAYKHSLKILNDGNGLLLFSQGTHMSGFENTKNGAAMFALKTNAPIIPVGISGSFKFFSKVTVKIGEPISMEEYQGQKIKSALVNEVMENVVSKVKELMK